MMEYIQALFQRFISLFLSESELDIKSERPSYDYSFEEDKVFHGVVTYLKHGYGIINDNVKFDSNDFRHIRMGDMVKGILHKEYKKWEVISLEIQQENTIEERSVVEIQQDWDNENNNPIPALNEGTLAVEDSCQIYMNFNEFRCIIEMVWYDIIQTNIKKSFYIGACDITYPPGKGDAILIRCSEEKKEEHIIAKTFEYVRTKTFLSNVTYFKKNCYIFDEKIYCQRSIYKGTPSKSENFYVVAVESNCDFQCNWRAVSICPTGSSRICKTIEFLKPMVLDDKDKAVCNQYLPQPPSEIIQSRESSNEVSVDLMPNIKLKELYSSTVLPITVRFDVVSPITLMGISIKSTNSVKQLSIDESEKEFPMVLNGNSHYKFTLSCTAKIAGATTERVVISFHNMSAFRDVNIMVGSIDVDETDTYLLPIKGVKPYVPKPFIPKRLPIAEIPEQVINAIATNDIEILIPTLRQTLTEDNFVNKMKLFLFLEEMEKTKLYMTYTIYKATFLEEGDFLTLNLTWMEDNARFIVGDKANVFPLSHDSKGNNSFFEGYIHFVEGTKIFLKFSYDSMVHIKNHHCRVEFVCSRTPFRKCHLGLDLVARTYGTSNLFPVVIPRPVDPQASYKEEGFAIVRNPLQQFHEKAIPLLEWINPNLNVEQKGAIRNILAGCSRPLPYIIFGPPGTGKTITIVEAISQIFLLVPHSRILVVAPSNSASDLITERLLNTEIYSRAQLTRLNGYNRARMSLPDSILDYCSDVSRIAEIVNCRVIICTSIVAASLYEEINHPDHFTHVFIDEAGHMTEAESSIALSFVSKEDGQVILAGDPKQLGPVVMSPIVKNYGFSVSMLARLTSSHLYAPDYTQHFLNNNDKIGINGNDASTTNGEIDVRSMYDSRVITLLVRNYRCVAPLIHISSQMFYHNALIAPDSREEDSLYQSWNMLPNKAFPLLFYGIHGRCTNNTSGSWENVMEANIVTEFVKSLLEHGILRKEIGVITPYRLQVKQIIHQLTQKDINSIDVGSVEKFQGQERGAMILSTVRSYSPDAAINQAYDIGFVANPERFNVSITRSKSLLIIVGDPTVLELNCHWKALLNYCRSQGGLIDTRGAELSQLNQQ